jgi:hypothetical protein
MEKLFFPEFVQFKQTYPDNNLFKPIIIRGFVINIVIVFFPILLINANITLLLISIELWSIIVHKTIELIKTDGVIYSVCSIPMLSNM